VAKAFGESLETLATRLRATSKAYIRCLKPNQRLKAGDWDDAFMTRQLEYSGLVEVALVRQAAFSHHRDMVGFLGYYEVCIKNREQRRSERESKSEISLREHVKALLNQLQIDPSTYLIGKSMVFLNGAAITILDEIRQNRIEEDKVLHEYMMTFLVYMTKRRKGLAKRKAIERAAAEAAAADRALAEAAAAKAAAAEAAAAEAAAKAARASSVAKMSRSFVGVLRIDKTIKIRREKKAAAAAAELAPLQPQPYNPNSQHAAALAALRDGQSNQAVIESAGRTEAQNAIDREVEVLVCGIKRLVGSGLGTTSPDKSLIVTFGAIAADAQLEQQLGRLVGTLKAARKRGLVQWKGQILLRGAHDNEIVRLVA